MNKTKRAWPRKNQLQALLREIKESDLAPEIKREWLNLLRNQYRWIFTRSA